MADAPFRKILVANRGEIALRVMRSAKELGCATVAVYSDADRDALHVRYADEAVPPRPGRPVAVVLERRQAARRRAARGRRRGPPRLRFLRRERGLRAARDRGRHDLDRPAPRRDRRDGRQDPLAPGDGRGRRAGRAGRHRPDRRRRGRARRGRALRLPARAQGSGGGGGKGLKIARTAEELESAFTTAGREATAYFGNGTIYAERYLENPKHVELQILADKHGTVLHVGERDCSLQRRHQKLWEEAPARISERGA